MSTDHMYLTDGYKCNDVSLATSLDAALAVVHFYKACKEGYFWLLFVVHVTNCEIICVKQSPCPNLAIVECRVNMCGNVMVLLCLTHIQYSIHVMHLRSDSEQDVCVKLCTMRSYIAIHPYMTMMCMAVPTTRGNIQMLLVNYNDVTMETKSDLRRITLGTTDSQDYCCLQYTRDGCRLFLCTIDVIKHKMSVYVVACPEVVKTQFLATVHPKTYPPELVVNTPEWVELCSTNFKPIFSKCHTKVAIPTIKADDFQLQVYLIAEPTMLAEHCRIVILKKIRHASLVCMLPIPQTLKHYLWWNQTY